MCRPSTKNYALSATLRGTSCGTRGNRNPHCRFERKRRESQPIAASAGCIKNPDQTPAGRLIEELGFKNFTVGRARVSEVHGNFIVNDGGATAEEILTSIEEIEPPPRESAASTLKPKYKSLEWTHDWDSEKQESRGATGWSGLGARECLCGSGSAVSRALRSLGAKVDEIDVRDGHLQLPSGVDLAYNMIHGTFGEDGQIQKS